MSTIPGQIDVDGHIEPAPAPRAWKQDRNGRQYMPREGGGMIFPRSELESPDEAYLRDQLARGVKDAAKKGKRAKPGRPRGKGRKPDPTPPGEKRDVKPEGPTPEMLAAAVELPLMLPMVWARMAWQCGYCAEHFKQTAPAAAADIVAYANESENVYLLRLLTAWQSVVSNVMGAGKFPGLVRYAGVPFLHHLAPEPTLNLVGPILGVPPRAHAPAHQHGPRHAETTARPTDAGGAPDTPPAPPASPPEPAGMADVAAAAANGDGPDQAELARLRAQSQMAERQRLAALDSDRLAREQMARRGPQPNIPPYAAGDRGPGPQAPAVPEGASSAGDPLPPEAEG